MSSFEIVITDYGSYDPARCFNGGAYWFRERATVRNGQIVDGAHTTSADFDFCLRCGSFESNMADHLDRFCYGGYQASPWMVAAARTADIALETGGDASAMVAGLFDSEHECSITVADDAVQAGIR